MSCVTGPVDVLFQRSKSPKDDDPSTPAQVGDLGGASPNSLRMQKLCVLPADCPAASVGCQRLCLQGLVHVWHADCSHGPLQQPHCGRGRSIGPGDVLCLGAWNAPRRWTHGFHCPRVWNHTTILLYTTVLLLLQQSVTHVFLKLVVICGLI